MSRLPAASGVSQFRTRQLVLAGTVLVAAAGAAVGWGSVLVEQASVVADEFSAAAEHVQQEAFVTDAER